MRLLVQSHVAGLWRLLLEKQFRMAFGYRSSQERSPEEDVCGFFWARFCWD